MRERDDRIINLSKEMETISQKFDILKEVEAIAQSRVDELLGQLIGRDHTLQVLRDSLSTKERKISKLRKKKESLTVEVANA